MGKKNEMTIYRSVDKPFKKSNVILSSKYKASLLENQILSINLAKIGKGDYTVENGSIVCRMHASELRKLLHKTNGSFYESLRPVAEGMTSRSLGINRPEEHTFTYISLISKADYRDGVFTIKFNPELEEYLQPNKNFTMLRLTTMLKFKSNASFRLYEILQSQCYHPDGSDAAGDTFEFDYQLSELKLLMGVVNADLDAVRRVLNASPVPDYDKAVEASPEQTFRRYSDFKKRVLDVAVKEINEKTNLHVEYTTVKGGRGGKVHRINFIVTVGKNTAEPAKEKKKELTEEERFNLYMNIKERVPVLEFAEIKQLAKSAEYDLESIEKAIVMMENSNSQIENPAGWLISCVQEKWYEEKPKVQSASEKDSGRKQTRKATGRKAADKKKVSARTDYEELEQILLENE